MAAQGLAPLDSTTNVVVRSIVDNLDAAVGYWDTNQICVFTNRASMEWVGRSSESIIGLSLAELLGPLYTLNLDRINAVYAGEKQIFEQAIPNPDGTFRHSIATCTPDLVNGKVQGMFVHIADVTSLKLLEDELRASHEAAEKLATHDYLTGIPNRVLLMDRIGQAISNAQRSSKLVALFTIDIDEFKQVNDRFGHGIGDHVLKVITTRLRESIRQSDTVARLGGDEFVVLAPEIERHEEIGDLAGRVVEGVRGAIEVDQVVIAPTISLGIAVFPREAATPDKLTSVSDQALYAAKRKGRNQFAVVDR